MRHRAWTGETAVVFGICPTAEHHDDDDDNDARRVM